MPHPPSAIVHEQTPTPPEVKGPPPRSSSRAWLWLVVIAAIAVGAYFLWPKFKPAAQANAAPAAGARKGRGSGLIPVVAVRATKGNIGVYITGLGAVTPLYTVTVKTRVDGEIMKVHYTEGQMVHQGDPLVEIDSRPYQVMLEQALGQLAKDQATLNNALVDQARYEKLLSQNAIPEQQLTTQKATVGSAQGAVKADQGAIDAAKLDLVYAHITSPISGRIGLRLVDPGNIVHATDSTGLLVITQMDPISVIFPIAEDQIPQVLQKMHAGRHLPVEAWDHAQKNKIATGVLQTIDNQIDETTATVKLRAQFENNSNALFPGQFVNARLLVEEQHGVTLVPNAAIQRNSQNTYVWVVKPNQTVTVHDITAGTTEGDETEIVSGVAPGDVVVTDGVDKLQDGTKVSAHVAGEYSRGARK